MLIDNKEKRIPIYRQCELLGFSRGSWYYKPVEEDSYNEYLMRLIDEQYTKTPFYGAPRITACLQRQGYQINHKRVERLMNKMGIHAIYPKPRLSKRAMEQGVFPYLLKGMDIIYPNQVWCTDITYIRMAKGFVYLVAIMDWFSRYVVSWALSNSLDEYFCIEALEYALKDARPEIFNSDQGCQFTSKDFIGYLEREKISISMDGCGRAYDNIFVERLWRTVKYEEVYINDYQSIREAKQQLDKYFLFYNKERLHQSLDYNTPAEIYYGEKKLINIKEGDKIKKQEKKISEKKVEEN